MTVEVVKSNISGDIRIQPSKSILHRALICACLSFKPCTIKNVNYSSDIEATISACEAIFGAEIERKGNSLTVSGNKRQTQNLIDCNESGSTLRFLIPFCFKDEVTIIKGKKSLISRPLQVFEKIAEENGILFEKHEDYLKLKGTLKAGEFNVRGDISSQFITGLLLYLPTLEQSSRIKIEGKLESKPYVMITIEVLKSFGVFVEFRDENTIIIDGNQKYNGCDIAVEGDYSHAAFFIALALMAGCLNIYNLNPTSLQGDRAMIEIVKRMGADIDFCGDRLVVKKSKLTGIDIDAGQIPDLVPVLAVLGLYAKGITRIYNAKRLAFKESNRLISTGNLIKALGGQVQVMPDGLAINGGGPIKGGSVKTYNDHRIVMSAAVAGSICSLKVLIEGFECVRKSAPDFYSEFLSAGGNIKYV